MKRRPFLKAVAALIAFRQIPALSRVDTGTLRRSGPVDAWLVGGRFFVLGANGERWVSGDGIEWERGR